MKTRTGHRQSGFTLIELLTALLILSIMALMSYRGLGAVLDAREHVSMETQKWRHVSSFLERFERDVDMAAPRTVRIGSVSSPAWLGRPETAPGPRLEFSRFASAEGIDTPRRIAYGLNAKKQIELTLWTGLDVSPDSLPARYPLLDGVKQFDCRYLNGGRAWVGSWPETLGDHAIPRAVRVRVVLGSGEEIVRIFELDS